MKKILTISIFCILSIICFSQGSNLEFSRVLLFGCEDGEQTVPAGKIWKITNVGHGVGHDYTYTRFWLDKGDGWKIESFHHGNTIFLPENVSIAAYNNNTSGSINNTICGLNPANGIRGHISVVEYTIVP